MNTPEIRNNEILAPETIIVRDKIIDKFGDKSLVEMNEFVKNFLRSESDPLNRLGAMAARVFILLQGYLSLPLKNMMIKNHSSMKLKLTIISKRQK